MTAGVSFQGSCYQDSESAAAAQCRELYPFQSSDSAGPYSVSCTGFAADSLSLSIGRSTGAEPITVAVAYAPCSTTSLSNKLLDSSNAAAAFGFGCSVVIFGYLVAWGCGRVLEAIGWD